MENSSPAWDLEVKGSAVDSSVVKDSVDGYKAMDHELFYCIETTHERI